MKGHLYSCLEGFKSDEGVFFFIDCTQCFTNVQRYKSTSYLNGYEQYLMIFFFLSISLGNVKLNCQHVQRGVRHYTPELNTWRIREKIILL